MNVKRFVAADMRRALELVKQEMGDNAIILSSKRTKSGVEILTSNDTPYEQARHTSQLADSFSNYGSLKPQFTAGIHRQHAVELPDGDEVAMDSDDAWNWEHTLQQVRQTRRGPASGKTREQLAREIEIARRKMEAADRIPLSQQTDLDTPRGASKSNNGKQERERELPVK